MMRALELAEVVIDTLDCKRCRRHMPRNEVCFWERDSGDYYCPDCVNMGTRTLKSDAAAEAPKPDDEVPTGLNDHTTDRDRPFTGQSHTYTGQRGAIEVVGLRFRDLSDCLIRAFVDSVPETSEEMRRCADDGTLNWNDVYDLDFSKVDPIAIVQNLGCRVEKFMGIFPNVPKRTCEGAADGEG